MVASDKCGCGDDSSSPFQKKADEKCSEKPSSEMETKKKPCSPLKYKEDKGKCHSSQEQFKEKSSDKCQSSKDELSQKDKCHSSQEAFFEGSQGKEDPCGQLDKSDKQCHEPLQILKEKKESSCGQLEKSDKQCHGQLQFSKEKKESSCGKSDKSDKQCHDQLQFLKEKKESSCGKSDKSENQCHEPLQFLKEKKESSCGQLENSDKHCHDSPQSLKAKAEGDKCPSSSKTIPKEKSNSSPSCLKYAEAKEEKPQCCGSSFENLKEESTLSKLSSYCKKFAERCLKLKSKCSSVDSCGEGSSLPEKGAPCQPTAETGLVYKPKIEKCSSQGTCLEIKKPFMTNYFPLDARNKQLNECIEKYMRIDPNQVISKCSRFANKTADLSGKYLETVKKSDMMKCVGKVKSSGALKMTSFMSPRGRHMVTRWGPSAGIYLTTAALFTVYVTEWKAVLKHVPLYRHLGQEDDKND